MVKRKKASTAIAIVLFLVFAVVGLRVFEVAKANPYMHDYVEEYVIPLPADNSPPSIQILHPANNTAFNSNNITLTFNVTFNKSNNISLSLTELYYKPSWQTTNNYLDLTALFVANNYSPVTFFSVNLTDVSEGPRWIEIFATAKAFAYETYHTISGIMYTQHYVSYLTEASAMVNFTIDQTPPTITVISFKDKTYDSSEVPLNFTSNEPIAQMTYSLDGEDNITVKGNTTLTGLSEGSHSVFLYALDAAGNIGKSETAHFTINTSSATPNPTPSTSPTQQPPSSTPPSVIADPAVDYPPALIMWGILALIIALGVVAYLYFEKREASNGVKKAI